MDAVGVIAVVRLGESLIAPVPLNFSISTPRERLTGTGTEALEQAISAMDREPEGIDVYQYATRSMFVNFTRWPRGSVSGPDESWVIGTATRLQEEIDRRFRTPFVWRRDVERVVGVLGTIASLALAGLFLRPARPLADWEIGVVALSFGWLGFVVVNVLLAVIRWGVIPGCRLRLVQRSAARAWYDHPLTRMLLAVGGLAALALLIWRIVSGRPL